MAKDFAKAVRKQDDETATYLIGVVHRDHPPAAIATADALRRKGSNGLWDTIADFFGW